MKKVISMVLLLIMLFTLCACGNDDTQNADPNTSSQAAGDSTGTSTGSTQSSTGVVPPAGEQTSTPASTPTSKPSSEPASQPESTPSVCSHSWKDATCTAPKTCTQCGATEGSVTSHNWSEATCAAPKTCSICGATEGNPAEHTLTAVCTVCGNTNAEYVELANKTWGYTDKDGSTIEIAQYSFYEGSLEIGYTNYKTLEKIAEDRNEDIAAIREEYTQYGMLKVIDGVEYGYNGWGMDNWSARKYTEENGVVTILFLSLDWDDNDEEVWTTKRTAILTRTGFREYTVTGGDYCKIGLKLTPAE